MRRVLLVVTIGRWLTLNRKSPHLPADAGTWKAMEEQMRNTRRLYRLLGLLMLVASWSCSVSTYFPQHPEPVRVTPIHDESLHLSYSFTIFKTGTPQNTMAFQILFPAAIVLLSVVENPLQLAIVAGL